MARVEAEYNRAMAALSGRAPPDHDPSSDAGDQHAVAADTRHAREARAREVDRLSLGEPRVGLGEAERWLAAEPVGEGRGWALRSIASAMRFNGAYERAEQYYAEAEQAFQDLGLADEVARTRVGRVDALRNLGRYEPALALARDNLAYLHSRGEVMSLEVARQNNNLGLVYWRLGDLRGALACFRRARTGFRRRQERDLDALASMNIGLVLAELGRYREALQVDHSAARHFRALGLRERLATVQMNLGLLHLRRGEYARALGELGASRVLCEELGLDAKRVAVDLDLARTYLALNLHSEAAEACARAVNTSRRLELPFELAHSLMYSGQAAERLGDLPTARAQMGEAEKVFARAGNAVWQAAATVQAIRLASRIEDATSFDDLIEAGRAAAARLETLGALEQAATAHLVVGGLLAQSGRTDEARASYGAATALGEQLGADEVLRLAYAARGTLDQTTAPEVALGWLMRAAEHLERLRERARADDLKMSVMGDGGDLYDRIAGLLIRADSSDRAREAFEWLERGKSRGLLEEALAASEPASFRRAPGVRRARERVKEVRARLNSAYTERYAVDRAPEAREAPAGSGGVERLEADLAQATRDLQMLVRGDRGADLSALRGVEPVQVALPNGGCLLEYALLGQELICFVVTRDSFVVERGLGTRRQLEEAAQWFWFHIRKGSFGAHFVRANQRTLAPAMDRALRHLGDLLLAPLAGVLDRTDHVVVVPHGLLHTLPFHALSIGGTPLLEHSTVSYAPSAAVFAAAECGDRPLTSPLVLAPDLPDLPWVGDEAERVAGLFPDAVLLTGRRATLKALRRNAPFCDALHLATHGVFRADNPRFSALELADGWLSVGELAELSGGRSLVTLSACHTGMSGIGPGDELLGLTRAVLGAGSRALVASLWAANDDTTATLMARFYAGLRQGQTRAASLRQASLDVRASEPHPYFWAPFILVGAP